MGFHICQKCGNKWASPGGKSFRPKRCPNCKDVNWDEPLIESCGLGGGICDICGCQFVTEILKDKFCPNCGSIGWNSGQEVRVSRPVAGHRFTHCCKKCGKVWNSHLEKPNRCPKCQTTLWNREQLPEIRYFCQKCGHAWSSHLKNHPEKCPHCGSRRWNK